MYNKPGSQASFSPPCSEIIYLRQVVIFAESSKPLRSIVVDSLLLAWALRHGTRAPPQPRFFSLRTTQFQNATNVHFTSHLVKEGDLLKVCNGGPRRYKFVLFSDMLVYGTETMRAKLQRDHRKYKVIKSLTSADRVL